MLPLPTRVFPACPQRRRALPPSLDAWLRAPGSLTARLRDHGAVTVAVQAQGRLRLSPQERRALRCCAGHVREVILLLDGQPAVWARSSTPLQAVKGPWRAVKGLGTRPLAELLFSGHRVSRGPLASQPLARHSPLQARLSRQWLSATSLCDTVASPDRQKQPGTPRWARHSVFRHGGQALQVMECFTPWVQALSASRPGTRVR
jgi:chorismate--pyruvate lyase